MSDSAAHTPEKDSCVCDPKGPCLGVPGESDACDACLALDSEEPCLHDPEIEVEDDATDGSGVVLPDWTRADDDARVDRLRPLAEHLRIGQDVVPEQRRYADTWLHIALLADEWFADHQPTEHTVTEAMVSAALIEYGICEHEGRVLIQRMIEAALRASLPEGEVPRG